jgi:hypothetical protein
MVSGLPWHRIGLWIFHKQVVCRTRMRPRTISNAYGIVDLWGPPVGCRLALAATRHAMYAQTSTKAHGTIAMLGEAWYDWMLAWKALNIHR